MSKLFFSLFYTLASGFSSIFSHSFMLGNGIGVNHFLAWFTNILAQIMNLITSFIWSIEKFILGIMDALEYAICSFLGIGTTIEDYALFGSINNITETFVKTFKAMVAVAIVFLIVFTIFAIVKQEWQNANNKKGFSPDLNKKGPILIKLAKSIMLIIVFPIGILIIFSAVNSTLTAFNKAMKGDNGNYTVATSVLSTASYDANKYRKYANENQRIPIIIEVYDADDYAADEKDKFIKKIKSSAIQGQLKDIRGKLADVTKNLSFNESLEYSNNQLKNSSKYGDMYESFICTPEQYQVMADFIDYVTLNQLDFYIRPVDDDFIEWKYVDTTVYNESNKSLTINYKDFNNVNGNSSVDDTYSITYSAKSEVTSPISNALNSIQALLGIDEYSNIVYNEMERDEDSLNMVHWANEKVSIHFSEGFDVSDSSTWTSTDEIIMYEFFHFSSNNDFVKYNLDDLSWLQCVTNEKPVTFDAYKYVYRTYLEGTGAYSSEKEQTLVRINGNYYMTELSKEEMDEYGDYYYVLKEYVDKGSSVSFLKGDYTTIFENKENEQALIKLTGKDGKEFNINDFNTWSYTDQIIMYEYYKDLSYHNKWSIYSISDFKNSGVKLPTYTISTHESRTDVSGTPKTYVLINGVYYEVELNGSYYQLFKPNGAEKFLDSIGNTPSQTFYNFDVKINNYDKYGISTDTTSITADDFIIVNTDTNDNSYYFNNSSNMFSYYERLNDGTNGNLTSKIVLNKTNSINTAFKEDEDGTYDNIFDIKFSNTFVFDNTDTWSYRDYFVFYLYSKYLVYGGMQLEQLNAAHNLYGKFGYIGLNDNGTNIVDYLYLFKIDESLLPAGVEIYLKIEDILNISEKNIKNDFDLDTTLSKNNYDITQDLDNMLVIGTENLGAGSNLSTQVTERKEFGFSSDINLTDVSTWTILDYALIVMHENGIIDILSCIEGLSGSVKDIYALKKEDLAKFKYSSTVYVNSGDKTNKFYCFGTGDNKIFINQYKIEQIRNVTNFEDWLNTKVERYIISQKDGTSITMETKDLVKQIYNINNLSNYQKSFDQLILGLVNEHCFDVDDSKFKLYKTINKVSYKNDNLDIKDLTTWTKLDFAIYCATGKVESKTYKFEIYSTSTTNYFIIDNYAYDLNAICGADGYTLTIENTITSEPIYLSIDNFDDAIKHFKSLNTSNDIVLVDPSEVIYKSNAVYEYQFDFSNFTYFDVYLAGLSDRYGFDLFDGINAGNPTKEFEISTYELRNSKDDSNITYLGIGATEIDENEMLVLLKINEVRDNSQISLNSKSELAVDNSQPLFSLNSEYKSFEFLSNEKNYKLMDAIIYNKTKKLESNSYPIYTLNSDTSYSYINVNNNFIRYDDSVSGKIENRKNNLFDTSKIDYEGMIDHLYNNYYKSLVVDTTGRTLPDTQTVKVEGFMLEIDRIENWNPLGIILYKQGVLEEDTIGDEQRISELDVTVYTSSGADNKKYMLFNGEINKEPFKFYVNITSIVDIVEEQSEGADKTYYYKHNVNAMHIMYLNTILNHNNDKNGNLNNCNDFRTTIDTTLSLTTSNKYSSVSQNSDIVSNNIIKINKGTEFSTKNIETWTWFDIFYYNLFGALNTTKQYNTYFSYNGTQTNGGYEGENFIKITKDYTSYYLKYNSSDWSYLTEKYFEKENDIEVTFDLSKNNTKVAIIYNILTGKDKGFIEHYKTPSKVQNNGSSFYKCNNTYIIISDIKESINGGIVKGKNDKTLFEYNCSATKFNISEWSLFDYFIKISESNIATNIKTINGTIYNISGVNYFSIQNTNTNLNMQSLGVGYEIENNQITIGGSEKLYDFIQMPRSVSNDVRVSGYFAKFADSLFGNTILESKTESSENGSNLVNLKLSSDFDFSNTSTWKLSDYLIYYIYEKTMNGEYKNFIHSENIKNFQYYVNECFINGGYIEAYTYALNDTNSTPKNCIIIGPNCKDLDTIDIEELNNYIIINYDLFYDLYTKKLTYVSLSDSIQTVDLKILGSSITSSSGHSITKFGVTFENEITSTDFIYDNYYYYKIKGSETSIYNFYDKKGIDLKYFGNLDSAVRDKKINLRLSTGFDIANVSTWTLLDYIIIYEFSRNVSNNIFYGMTLDNLQESDFYVKLYTLDSSSGDSAKTFVLVINGNNYNITNWYTESTDTFSFGSGDLVTFLEKVSASGIKNGYSIKVLSNSLKYNLNKSRNDIVTKLSVGSDTFVYTVKANIGKETDGDLVILDKDNKNTNENVEMNHYRTGVDVSYYRTIKKEVYQLFRWSLDIYPVYKLSPIVKTVSWPQKLMNDMKITYPDLNWETLIATDGWFDTLGDYHSGTVSGQFIASGNSANITAVGMVLSEFFLSVTNETQNGYANYEYSSIFDESTIQALMLAMLGEEKYEALVQEAKIFVDLFNTGFASIIDSIASERGIDIIEGSAVKLPDEETGSSEKKKENSVTNLAINVYKTYLATAILSSDVGEYLYTIATRVYAQYTIYESLARANGKYADYYAYINGLTDESGQVVDSFVYATFYELVKYENLYKEYALNGNEKDYFAENKDHKEINLKEGDIPTFTFNYKSMYKRLVEKGYLKSKSYVDGEWTSSFDDEAAKSLATYKDESLLDWITSLVTEIATNLGKSANSILDEIKEALGCRSFLELLLLRKTKTFEEVKNELTKQGNDVANTVLGYWDRLVVIFTQPENTFMDVMNAIDDYYNDFYCKNASNLVTQTKISSKDSAYSFMFDVYYTIKQEVKIQETRDPEYIKIYRQYMFGDIDRWAMVSDATIEGGSVEIQNYGKHLAYRELAEIQLIAEYISCYGFSYNADEEASNEENSSNLQQQISSSFDVSNYETYVNMLNYTFDYAKYLEKTNQPIEDKYRHENIKAQEAMAIVFFNFDNASALSVAKKVADISFNWFRKSEDGNMTYWDNIKELNDALGIIVEEVKEILDIMPGDLTDNGSIKIADFDYSKIYSKLVSFQNLLGTYISEQELLDTIQKTCLTFTLAQYGINFVEEGLELTINGSTYNIKSAVSTKRLAEYVYGGSFLTQYGVYPQFTSEEFEGVVKITTAYDDVDKIAKKQINTFTHLREFAREIADYTSKLYLLTNLNDLSESVSDSINLTDYVAIKNPIVDGDLFSERFIKTTPEYLILDYMIANKYLSYETFYANIIAENEISIIVDECGDTDMQFFKTNTKTSDLFTPEEKEQAFIALRKYLLYIQTDRYSGAYTRGDRNRSERVHEVFVKVISYLTGYSEDDSNGANTDYSGFAVSYDGMNFKSFKTMLMNALIDYRQYENSTGEENTNRYISIFYLISSEFNHFISDTNYITVEGSDTVSLEDYVGRTINQVNKIDSKDNDSTLFANCETVCYRSFGKESYMRMEFKLNSTTREMILKLANIPNRPIEELVDLEYNELYNKNGYYDEALGDSFVICTYDEVSGKYYPILSRSRQFNIYTGNYRDYLAQPYSVEFKTDIVKADKAYPIMARGIITPDGMPTAIRMVNGELTFYRYNIGASASPGEDLNSAGTISSEVETIKYTTYVNKSVYGLSGKSSKAMFISAVNKSYEFKPSADVYYVQTVQNYQLSTSIDNENEISALEDFQAFYIMGIGDNFTFHILMCVGFFAVLPVLLKALLASMVRILDLALLILIGPVCISTNSLDPTEKQTKIFETWKEKLTKSLLSAFGLIASFSMYFILINTAMNMTYITDNDRVMQIIYNNPAINKIIRPVFNWLDENNISLSMVVGGVTGVIGFIGSGGTLSAILPAMGRGGIFALIASVLDSLGIYSLDAGFFNSLIKIAFIFVGAMMIQSAAELIGELVTGGRVSKAFNSQLSDQDPLQGIISVVNSLKDTATKMRDIYTGEALINALEAAKETAARTIPGSTIIRKINDVRKDHKDKNKAKKLSKMAQDRGMSKANADKLTKDIANLKIDIRNKKKAQHMERANAFLKTMGVRDDDSQFFSQKEIGNAKKSQAEKDKLKKGPSRKEKNDAKNRRKRLQKENIKSAEIAKPHFKEAWKETNGRENKKGNKDKKNKK